MNAKNIFTFENIQADLIDGFQTASRLVELTMGPGGRSVMMERDYGGRVTRDGVGITRVLEFKDPKAKLAADLLTSVAVEMSDLNGDGTATAVVLTVAIIEEGVKARIAGLPVDDLRNGLDSARDCLIDRLQQIASFPTGNMLTRVANTASHDAKDIADVAVQALSDLHADGFVSVETGEGFETTIRKDQALNIDQGFIAIEFASRSSQSERVLNDPYVLVSDMELNELQPLIPLLDAVHETNRPMLIIASSLQGEALSTLVTNDRSGAFSCVGVRAPNNDYLRTEALLDIAAATGATLISSVFGMKLEEVSLSQLGQCSRVTINTNRTSLEGGIPDKKNLEERRKTLRAQRDNAESEFELDRLSRRLAWLSGESVSIEVGGLTDDDIKERRDRAVNCVHSVRSAMRSGVVAGSGYGLVYAGKALSTIIMANDGEQAGVNILKNAIERPSRQVLHNQGKDAGYLVGMLKEGTDYAQLMEHHNPLDPLETVNTALTIAVSAAKTWLSTECFVLNATPDK